MVGGGTVWPDSKALKIAGRWVATWVKPHPDEGHKPTFTEAFDAVYGPTRLHDAIRKVAFGLGDGAARWGGTQVVVPARTTR